MIRHVTLFTWTAGATDAQIREVATGLAALPPLMTGLRAYHFGPDAGLVRGNADFAVVADFDDAQSYLAYRGHPAHRAVVEQLVQPIAWSRVMLQFEI